MFTSNCHNAGANERYQFVQDLMKYVQVRREEYSCSLNDSLSLSLFYQQPSKVPYMCSSFCLPLYIYVFIFLSSSSSLYSCVHFLFSYRSTHMDDVCIIPKSLLYRMILSGHHLLREELGEQLLFCTCPCPFPIDYYIMPYRIMSYHVMSSLCYHYSVILPLFYLDFLSVCAKQYDRDRS